jgi:TerC family integral membrane protein
MIVLWSGFIGFVLLMLALDLGVFHRQAHVVTVKETLGWSAVWAMLGLAFSVFVYCGYENHWLGLGSSIDAADGLINDGTSPMVKYLTGYVVEKSLSVDNIFVIAMIFGFFAVPAIHQHRVLFWGILGALLMRGAMIALGATLIAEFHWILYLFGAFLILTGIKMLVLKTDHSDPNQNIIVRLTRERGRDVRITSTSLVLAVSPREEFCRESTGHLALHDHIRLHEGVAKAIPKEPCAPRHLKNPTPLLRRELAQVLCKVRDLVGFPRDRS